MATYTRQQLKEDRLVTAAQSGANWVEQNRSRVVALGVAAVVVLAAIIVSVTFYNSRKTKAENAFGEALRTYSANIRPAGVPADPTQESYASTQERAKAALAAFENVADKYSSTPAGKDARYYAGIAAADSGQTQTAEDQFKQAADHGGAEVSSLAQMALASLYHGSGRDPQAVDIYKHLIDHPTVSVPVNASRLQLAAIYEKTNIAEARKLWAQVKDSDKTATGQPGAAAQIASDKLSGKA